MTLRRKKVHLLRMLKALEKGREHYQRADEIMECLRGFMAPGDLIEFTTGPYAGRYELIDNFANGKNSAFRQARVRRFEIKKQVQAKRPAKASAVPAMDPSDVLPA